MMEGQDDGILSALEALAEHDRTKEAPPSVEIRLRRLYQRQRTIRRMRRSAILAGTIAAAAAGFLVWSGRVSHAPIAHPAQAAATASSPAPLALTAVEPGVITPKPRQLRARPARREIVTEFFPLADAAPPLERGTLIRVRVPAAAIEAAGLPVSEEHRADLIDAEVLVGEEGLARAIRFVKLQQ